MPTLSQVRREFIDAFAKRGSRKRVYDIPDDTRPSQVPEVVLDAQRFAPRVLAGLDATGIGELEEWLTRTYTTAGRQAVPIGRSGSKEVSSILVKVGGEDTHDLRVKFAVSRAGAMELWKSAHTTAHFLNPERLMGYTTVVDWTSQEVRLEREWVPFYIVERNGKENLVGVLQSGDEVGQGAQSAVNFFKDFAWSRLRQDETTRTLARAHATRTFQLIEEYLALCPAEIRTQRTPHYEVAKDRFLRLLTDDLPVTPIAADATLDNIINMNGNVAIHLAFTDQGYRPTQFARPVTPGTIKGSCLGVPYITLGLFVMSANAEPAQNIPEASRRVLSSEITNLANGTRWGDARVEAGYTPDLVRSALSLGQLQFAVSRERRAGYGATWARVVDTTIKNISEGQFTYSP